LQLREQALIEPGLPTEVHLLESELMQPLGDESCQRRRRIHGIFTHRVSSKGRIQESESRIQNDKAEAAFTDFVFLFF
jgi:hypothetical protein